MLPDETRQVQNIKGLKHFSAVQFFLEYIKFNYRDQKHIMNNFKKFTDKMHQASSNVGGIISYL